MTKLPQTSSPAAVPIIGIVAKPTQPVARDYTGMLLSWIQGHNLDYRVDEGIADELGAGVVPPEKILSRDKFTQVCTLIVVLGGDGTFISVTRHPAHESPTVLGVNLGTLGFLTEITTNELFATLEAVLHKRVKLQRRPLLCAKLVREGSERRTYFAINDVVVTKEALARIFAIELKVNRARAAFIRGDGVIVSTPSGSTAYSLAAGGSLVHPEVDAILVTPICPHSLTVRPLILPGAYEVTLRVSEDDQSADDTVFLTVDGQEGEALHPGDEIVITTSAYSIYVVNSPSRSYFDILGTKLKWANQYF